MLKSLILLCITSQLSIGGIYGINLNYQRDIYGASIQVSKEDSNLMFNFYYEGGIAKDYTTKNIGFIEVTEVPKEARFNISVTKNFNIFEYNWWKFSFITYYGLGIGVSFNVGGSDYYVNGIKFFGVPSLSSARKYGIIIVVERIKVYDSYLDIMVECKVTDIVNILNIPCYLSMGFGFTF